MPSLQDWLLGGLIAVGGLLWVVVLAIASTLPPDDEEDYDA